MSLVTRMQWWHCRFTSTREWWGYDLSNYNACRWLSQRL